MNEISSAGSKYNYWNIGAALCGVYVLAYAAIGFFAFPSADDYAFLDTLHDYGFLSWEAQYQWYSKVTGRYAFNFIGVAYTSFDYIGAFFDAYRVLPLLLIALAYSSVYFCVKSCFPDMSAKKAALISLFCQALWLSQLPGLNEALYWMSASVMYFTPLCVTLFEAGFMVRMLRGERVAFNLTVLSALAFLNSGFVEFCSVFSLLILLAAAVWCVCRKDNKSALLLVIPIILSVSGIYIDYISPATQHRADLLGQERPAFITLIKSIFLWGIPVAVDGLLSPLKYVLLLLLPDVLKSAAPRGITPVFLEGRLKIWHALLLTVIGAFCFTAIEALPGGIPLMPRGEAVAQWALWFCWIVYFVFLYGNETTIGKIERTVFYKYRYILIAVCMLLSVNTRYAWNAVFDAPEGYAQESYRRAVIMETPRGERAYVPLLTTKSKLLHNIDFAPAQQMSDSQSWINEAAAAYYGVSEIYAIPADIFEKHPKSEYTFGEYLESLKESASNGGVDAMLTLGRIYDRIDLPPEARREAPIDFGMAKYYYGKAAEAGNVAAARSLLRIPLLDRASKPDYGEILRYGARYLFNRYVMGG